MSEPKILKVVTGLKTNGTTINSKGTDYAVIGKWADGNTSNQNRLGLFVKLDNLTEGMTMSIAGPDDSVRGVITSTPAFCENAQSEYFNDDGTLKTGYDYVGVLGVVTVLDDGTLEENDYCIPNSEGKAVKVDSTHGYQVIDRVDSTHVRIIVEPGADSDYRVSKDLSDSINRIAAIADMIVTNNFITPICDDDGTTIIDENGKTILANWKYKEV